MNAPFKGPIQNEPTRNMHTTLQQEMESCSHGNLCSALPSATKMTTNITKTTDDDRGGKENLFLFSLAKNDFGQHQPSNFKVGSATPARFGLVLKYK